MQKTQILHHLLKTKLIPSLKYDLYKGQAGRVGVIGGCLEYTGAPYYAAVSALKCGADLSFVICSTQASMIKAYSPEIMVYPVLIEDGSNAEAVQKASELLQRIHTLVVGPGLGRNAALLQAATELVEKAKQQKMPIVFDGDGLYLVSTNPQLVHGYARAILTPNQAEYLRLCAVKKIDANDATSLSQLCKAFGNIIIVRKGQTDTIAMLHNDAMISLACNDEGSPRRCGGIGDLLAGTMATFVTWAVASIEQRKQVYPLEPFTDATTTITDSSSIDHDAHVKRAMMLGAYGACRTIRLACNLAFAKHFRGTTAPDILAQIPYAFEQLYSHKDE